VDTVSKPELESLYVPDRFEGLSDVGDETLRTIIHEVRDGLAVIDRRFEELAAARRGGLLLLHGTTGAGKSTFLDTVGIFRDGFTTVGVDSQADVRESLGALEKTDSPRIVVMEGREALGQGSLPNVEQALHDINAFVRSPRGRDTLVVWPTNKADFTKLLVDAGNHIGGEALFGVGDPIEVFEGPRRDDFVRIAEKTVEALNDGATLAALGIADEEARRLAAESTTIGNFLARVRHALSRNKTLVRQLMPIERYRMWTLVISGSDSAGFVAAVTRGSQSYADIPRLMSSTGANVVKELKKQPDRLGLLGSSLDARIFNMDMVTVLSVAREYGDAELHSLMQAEGMSTTSAAGKSAAERLKESEIGQVIAADELSTLKPGPKAGDNTKSAFGSLAVIAQQNDGAINRAIGRGLKEVGLVDSYEAEKDLGTDLKFTSDLYVLRSGEPIRIEVMWRTSTSRAAIANYVLGKLRNYGRAIGYLQ
jgi:DNA (cytosine-5)-methyltransferase 1